ncbi:RluA family pseudouridine synthase [Parasphingorhabdus halotolerans]|uniref:Ribosomal large subunit pseudouridine synthase D n=1 Tax=Parasphingorhabdus halotolerans TaxID=2725558 RepID=A0A6H2DP40_9SPHN|nr:RluA family pseudouridine synthase [Parasphingorhabdus halotolerans]QJB70429.1 RluA family pseudouridine synthase [Parasphingorhabdus halotolerans]
MSGFDPTAESGSEEEAPKGTLKDQKQALKVLDVRQFTVSADDEDIRVDRWFKRHMEDVPFNIVSRWARTGQLRLDGKRVSPGDRINAGQVLRVPPAEIERPGRVAKPRIDLSKDQIDFAQELVIHKDKAAIIVNKPPGLATQGGSKTNTHLDGLLDALTYDAKSRPKLVHRLDKDTSGVILLARSPGAAAFFSKRFSGRTARKVYWAIVMGVPEIADGMIELPLSKQPGSGGEKMHVDEENGAAAKSRYRIIERAGNRACWVELQPFTGRTHQLRVHMAAIGHPILGDGKYGGKDAFLTGAISRKMHLHARRLRIEHPDGHNLDVSADLPHHFADTIANLGFDMELGDLPLDEKKPGGKMVRKQQAKHHAKQIRKDKRGERRARGENEGKPVKAGKPTKRERPNAGKATHKKNMPHKAKVKTALNKAGKKPAPKKTGPKSSKKTR